MPDTQRARRGHDFLPPAAELAEIPALYGTEPLKAKDKIVHLHYFIGSSDWWITELDQAGDAFDTEAWTAFGYMRIGGADLDAEWGYVSLTELEVITVRAFVIERDLYWKPGRAQECLPARAWQL
jgi:hypothetical protein